MHLAVNVAVLDGPSVLLMQREDFEVWCLPGGQVDGGESVATAAVREVREETGLNVSLTAVVGIYSRAVWHEGIHVVLFTARPVDGRLEPDPVEVAALGWFDRDALPSPLLVGQAQRIDDVFEGRRGVARSSSIRSPFASRAEAYRARDASGMARAAFYDVHLADLDDEDVLDVGG